MKAGVIVAIVIVLGILVFGGGLMSSRNQLITERESIGRNALGERLISIIGVL